MADTTSRQQRRAAEREKARRLRGQPQSPSRSRLLVALTISGLLVLVIIGLVLVKLSQDSPSNTSTRVSASVAAVRSVSSIPASTYNAVGYQPHVTLPSAVKGKPLTRGGKPVIIYLGAEYCPYCAAQRWAIVSALTRFGTFKHLGATHSSSIDVYPSTPTFSFHGSTFSSPYVVLSAVETNSNKIVNQHYAPLDRPTAEQIKAYNTYNSTNAIPFTDIANRYVATGASYNPEVLQGLSMTQIASALHNPNSDVAKAVLGSANGLTAAICSQTGGKPANVCSSTAVTSTAPHLGK